MARYQTDRRADIPPCTGILVTNLGTPKAPTIAATRRFLGQFLADPRVVEAPRLIWRLILHGFVLRIRPKRSAESYKAIWTEAGSPLLVFSELLTQQLQQTLERKAMDRVKVALAMRYGEPSIAVGLEALRVANMERLLILPLYPQYAAATTASTFDAVANVLKTWRRLPEVRMINGYHDHPAYIRALANSVRAFWQDKGQTDRLLFSFHGIPLSQSLAGDPYGRQCQETARLVAEQLKLSDESWDSGFQSRFGPKEWLKPYTDRLLQTWAKEGVKSVSVICPSFAVDCLETLEEINIRYRQIFMEAGGDTFNYIPALNDTEEHVDTLVDVIMKRPGRPDRP